MKARRIRSTRPTAERAPRLQDRPALGTIVTPFHRVEPVELERPENALLDRIEEDVAFVMAGGGEAALVARLRRLVPSLKGGRTDG